MVVDFDDFCEDENRLDLLEELRAVNPEFRCTVFAIPGKGSLEFWAGIPEWIELAVHGWNHPHSREAQFWTYDQTVLVMRTAIEMGFAGGFKAPGWQVSDETYRALAAYDWWIADHWDNDYRRSPGIRAHVVTADAASGLDPEHWHGHIPDVCGNGIAETFDRLRERVAAAESFEFISEVVK